MSENSDCCGSLDYQSEPCGHCKMMLLIIGFQKYFGPLQHAHRIHKIHTHHKSSLPIDYGESDDPLKALGGREDL